MSPKQLYSKAFYERKGLTPDEEQVIAQDPKYAYLYAVNVLRSPFPAGEAALSSAPEYKQMYDSAFEGLSNTTDLPKFESMYREAITPADTSTSLEQQPTKYYKNLTRQHTDTGRFINQLMDELSDEFDFDMANSNIKKTMELTDKLDQMKNFIVDKIRSSDIPQGEQNHFIRSFLGADSVSELLMAFAFGPF